MSAVYAKYVSTPIHPFEFPQKNQFPKKPGFPLSALIILDQSNVDLFLFKKESGKNRTMVNRVYLAIPKRATSPVEMGRNQDVSIRFQFEKHLN